MPEKKNFGHPKKSPFLTLDANSACPLKNSELSGFFFSRCGSKRTVFCWVILNLSRKKEKIFQFMPPRIKIKVN